MLPTPQSCNNFQEPPSTAFARKDRRRFINLNFSGGRTIKCLLDSGASANVLTYEDYQKLGTPAVRPTGSNLSTANGSSLDTIGIVTLKLCIKGILKEVDFEISRNVTKSILGEEALEDFNIIKWKLPIGPKYENTVLSTKEYIVPSGKTAFVNCIAKRPDKDKMVIPKDILIDPISTDKFPHIVGIYTGIYNQNTAQKVQLKVGNTTANPIVIKRGDVLGIFDDVLQEPVEGFKPDNKQEDIALNNIPSEITVQNEQVILPSETILNPQQIFEQIDTKHLTDDDIQKLKGIVMKNIETFASSKR